MTKREAISYFKTQKNIARVCGISIYTVCRWPEVIPHERACQLEIISKGALRVNHKLYDDIHDFVAA